VLAEYFRARPPLSYAPSALKLRLVAKLGSKRQPVAAVALAAGLVVLALPLGCGKSRKPGPNPSATGGTGGSAGGSAAGAVSAGGIGGVAGRAASGGATSDAGSAGESGAPAGDAGAQSGNGGVAATGGAASTTGGSSGEQSSGGAGAAGAAGAAGMSGAGGFPAACTDCRDLETCWTDGSGSRCIASSVPLPNGVRIDRTEVTREQYFAWLVREPATTDQPGECDWNDAFMPDPTCMTGSAVCQGEECATHPQPCVDLCDALAYCAAIGRHLCTESEWTSACSSDGAHVLGREEGGSFGMSTCNDYVDGRTTTVAVGSKPGCQPPLDSGFAGVFDLIGNVEEWVDDCRAADEVCSPRGLSYGMGAAAPNCSQSTYAVRSMARENLGFRCCSP
jgi:formylglycine-generating enzyme